MSRFKRVIIGVSGGVDSAVSAFLLKSKGFDVHGVFMKNWDTVDEQGICSAEVDYNDARLVCSKLKIPLTRVDFVKQYWNEVFSHLIKDYEAGLTPNPDILCNRHVKFNYFYNYCQNTLNADAIATGHYANSSFGPYLENYKDRESVKLLQPFDLTKDQTFFLSQIKQLPLRRTMFPLATLKKTDVRLIAKREGLLNVATKKDSTGICFVGKRRFQDFISEYIESKPGIFIDIDSGKVVGKHEGIHQWTLGQRCRLGGNKKPYFIFKKDLKENKIYVALGTDHLSIHSRIFTTNIPHWIYEEPKELRDNKVLNCYFRFQNTLPLLLCKVVKCPNGLIVELEKPLRAISPGQYAVFFNNNECLGSSRIVVIGPSLYFLDENTNQIEK